MPFYGFLPLGGGELQAPLGLQRGTAAAPSIYDAEDSGEHTGFFFPALNQIAMSIDGFVQFTFIPGATGGIQFNSSAVSLLDANSNEVLSISGTSSAVNEVTVANAVTGSRPSLSASGGDTNIDLLLAGQNTGVVQVEDALSVSNNTEGNTARLNLRTAQEAVNLSGATTDTTINIPSGARLLGASFCVNTAVTDDAGDDTWSAAYTGGSTTSLASGAAAAQNTKVDTQVADEIASAQTNIRFTPNGGNFSAGVIEVVAYYEDLTSLADA